MENIETSLQLDRDQFFMPNYCILWECAHHSPNKQQTFSSEFDWVDHWKKYHREVLDCFLKANPACLTFLGVEKCPANDCNCIYFDERAAMVHYEEEVHNPLRSMSYPEVEDMVDDIDTDELNEYLENLLDKVPEVAERLINLVKANGIDIEEMAAN